MALEKLKIIIDSEQISFSVLFNPSQITLDKSAAWDSPPVVGRNAAEAQFRYGNPYTLAVDLLFDTYELGTDVRVHTRQFSDLLMIRGDRKQPPRCKLEWGSHDFNGYHWVLERLSQRFTLFLPDGTPVRATLGCSFKQSQSADEEQEEVSKASQVDQVVDLPSGQTLAHVASKLLGDPRAWPLIAKANNILNPLRVRPGRKLFIPALGAALGSKKNSSQAGKAGARSSGYQVKIESVPLKEKAADVLSIRVRHDLVAPSLFELKLRNLSETRPILSDDSRFAVGNQVEIAMGEIPQRVFVGEITGLELEFRPREEVLTVRGYDLGHRLLRGRRTRSWVNKTDSAIVREVAEEAGLDAKVDDTKVKLPYVLQDNQTDWDFLLQRAGDLGFALRVEDKTLLFQRYRNDTSAVLRFERKDQSLLEFRPRLSTVGLAGKVVVQGWSARDKKAITSLVAAGDEGTTMGGSRGGLVTAEKAFSAMAGTVAAVVDRPVSSQAEADQIARGWLREMALSYITGEGLVLGCADLKAGTVIGINDFGEQLSGLYYVTSVCHTFSRGGRYRTAFTVRRNAA
ncbi:MAG TPA: contractile injection system protein, VgrG/Pvc8 family [Thermoanaerobaculia bacterium]|nr:contractile injection system protein, VgrG/Pvc8 family [Thermoanaerobaculia bacterium]